MSNPLIPYFHHPLSFHFFAISIAGNWIPFLHNIYSYQLMETFIRPIFAFCYFTTPSRLVLVQFYGHSSEHLFLSFCLHLPLLLPLSCDILIVMQYLKLHFFCTACCMWPWRVDNCLFVIDRKASAPPPPPAPPVVRGWQLLPSAEARAHYYFYSFICICICIKY